MTITFSLKPFNRDDIFRDLKIAGKISRRNNGLKMLYEISGPLEGIAIPPLSERPERMDRLWESTCFELFLKEEDKENYWEFNLSPSGHWNVFRFTAYRQGMQEEALFNSLPFTINAGRNLLRLRIEVNIEKILAREKVINAGICAVTEDRRGRIAYWAMAHPGRRPDFHRPGSFIIKLK